MALTDNTSPTTSASTKTPSPPPAPLLPEDPITTTTAKQHHDSSTTTMDSFASSTTAAVPPATPSLSQQRESITLLSTSPATADHYDTTSMEILSAAHLELFPKKEITFDAGSTDDDTSKLRQLVQQHRLSSVLLNGEYIEFLGRCGKANADLLAVTNYRLFVLAHGHTAFVNVPLMLIEYAEQTRELLSIVAYLKSGKTVRVAFASCDKCTVWFQRLNALLTRPYKLEELFAFRFYSWFTNENTNSNNRCLFAKQDQEPIDLVYKEFKRMRFDDEKCWRVAEQSAAYELCGTYPRCFIVPKCITDAQLNAIANFRSSRRFPVVVWRSRTNGAVLARSSQPNVGVFGWRDANDELLIRAIAESTQANQALKHHHHHHHHKKNYHNKKHLNGVANGDADESSANNESEHEAALRRPIRPMTPVANSTLPVTMSVTDHHNNENSPTNGGEHHPSTQATNSTTSTTPNLTINGGSSPTTAILLTSAAATTTNGTNNSTDLVNTVQQQQSGATTNNNTGVNNSNLLIIIDARTKTVALANRVKGGGYEYSEYYTNCEIQFMNLENIHVIRSSFQSLRLLCQATVDNKTFYSQLETTKWLHHLSGILKAAGTVVSLCDRQAKPVLIHCSDGWDRTPQILALAKLMLDPYYRRIGGFQTLIDTEWLMYGHKFAQRNGHASPPHHVDVNERCPVFLQWLDCVYQLLLQFPWAFEFNETFLLKLCAHSYACLFGSFLCDSSAERAKESIYKRTFGIWSYLNDAHKEFVNPLYDDDSSAAEVLYPASELVHMQLWRNLFCESELTYLVPPSTVDSASLPSAASTEDIVCCHNEASTTTTATAPELDLPITASSLLLLASSPPSVAPKVTESGCSGSNSLMNTSGNGGKKTRSFDDLSKLSSTPTAASFIAETDETAIPSVVLESAPPAAMTTSSSTTAASDAVPIPVLARSLSESNLLLRDALLTSTSPHFSAVVAAPKPPQPARAPPPPPPPSVVTNLVVGTTFDKNSNVSETEDESVSSMSSSSAMSSSSSRSSDEPLPPLPLLPSSQDSTSMSSIVRTLLTTTTSASIAMQNSTDTLVGDELLATTPAKTATPMSPVLAEKAEIEPPSQQAPPPLSISSASASASVSGSSTPLSTPSPTTTASSSINIRHQHQNGNGAKSAAMSVSTSTSGLLEYVNASKYRFLNEKINCFERALSETTNGVGVHNGANFQSELLAAKRANSMAEPQLQQQPVASKVESKKRRQKKTLHDCIDVDGLTKVEDRACRKVVEREDQLKKEIGSLQEQLQKYKTFLSSLPATIMALQQETGAGSLHHSGDYHEMDKHEKPFDENHHHHSHQANYSLSTDSTCSSSWDEIEEFDYRLASWVPDYYVTHCQNCNRQFHPLLLRKHHCRNCGQIFCGYCANQFYPLPNHNLIKPQRICQKCKQLVLEESLALSSGPAISAARKTTTTTCTNTMNKMIPPPPAAKSGPIFVNNNNNTSLTSAQAKLNALVLSSPPAPPATSPQHFARPPMYHHHHLGSNGDANNHDEDAAAETSTTPILFSSSPATTTPGSECGLNHLGRCCASPQHNGPCSGSKSQKVSV